jgi:Flp pilus assembly pilin Flp
MSPRARRADVRGMGSAARLDRLRSCLLCRDGQTMAEYVVVLAVITPAIVLAFATFSSAIAPLIDSVRSFL